MATDATVFFGLWLQKPLHIAATNPSSARLADAFARCVELERPGPVLELGAGTGSLTRGLLRAGCPTDRILAVEREPRLAAMLRRDLPGMTVIEGDATKISQYLAGRVERLCAVVSSLPIKWFPLLAQRAVVDPCLELLGPGGQFLQLTNAFSSPLPLDRLGIAGREIGRVWLNLLPAQIWSYSRCPETGPKTNTLEIRPVAVGDRMMIDRSTIFRQIRHDLFGSKDAQDASTLTCGCRTAGPSGRSAL